MRGQNSEDHPDRRPAPKGDPIRETRLRPPQSPPPRRSVLLRPRLAAGGNAKREESKRQFIAKAPHPAPEHRRRTTNPVFPA